MTSDGWKLGQERPAAPSARHEVAVAPRLGDTALRMAAVGVMCSLKPEAVPLWSDLLCPSSVDCLCVIQIFLREKQPLSWMAGCRLPDCIHARLVA